MHDVDGVPGGRCRFFVKLQDAVQHLGPSNVTIVCSAAAWEASIVREKSCNHSVKSTVGLRALWLEVVGSER